MSFCQLPEDCLYEVSLFLGGMDVYRLVHVCSWFYNNIYSIGEKGEEDWKVSNKKWMIRIIEKRFETFMSELNSSFQWDLTKLMNNHEREVAERQSNVIRNKTDLRTCLRLLIKFNYLKNFEEDFEFLIYLTKNCEISNKLLPLQKYYSDESSTILLHGYYTKLDDRFEIFQIEKVSERNVISPLEIKDYSNGNESVSKGEMVKQILKNVLQPKEQFEYGEPDYSKFEQIHFENNKQEALEKLVNHEFKIPNRTIQLECKKLYDFDDNFECAQLRNVPCQVSIQSRDEICEYSFSFSSIFQTLLWNFVEFILILIYLGLFYVLEYFTRMFSLSGTRKLIGYVWIHSYFVGFSLLSKIAFTMSFITCFLISLVSFWCICLAIFQPLCSKSRQLLYIPISILSLSLIWIISLMGCSSLLFFISYMELLYFYLMYCKLWKENTISNLISNNFVILKIIFSKIMKNFVNQK